MHMSASVRGLLTERTSILLWSEVAKFAFWCEEQDKKLDQVFSHFCQCGTEFRPQNPIETL